MGIREIAGLWCDDITFCPEKCGWKDCPRNKENIRDRSIPHSFSVEIPSDCPKKQEMSVKWVTDTDKANALDWLNEIVTNPKYWRMFYSDSETKSCAEATLELLKEQEAKILDWDELEYWGNAVWFEDKDEHECYIALIANVGTYDAKFVNVEPGMVHRLDFLREFYKKEWRCWSARPTIKQRQAVKLE